MKINIFVTTIKKYKMPESSLYIPIQVGAEMGTDLGYMRDDSGENISFKNPIYSEYTAFYWIWKNIRSCSSDVIGLNQYRRYFTEASKIQILFSKDKYKLILNEEQIEKIFSAGYDCVMPKITNLGTQTVRENYGNSEGSCFGEIDAAGETILTLYPEYYDDFQKVMHSHYAYLRSIFLMKRSVYDEYCEWLFSILEHMEKIYGFTSPRVYGYLGERLINVFLSHQNLKIKELNYVHMEMRSTIGLWYLKVLVGRLRNKLGLIKKRS